MRVYVVRCPLCGREIRAVEGLQLKANVKCHLHWRHNRLAMFEEVVQSIKEVEV